MQRLPGLIFKVITDFAVGYVVCSAVRAIIKIDEQRMAPVTSGSMEKTSEQVTTSSSPQFFDHSGEDALSV